MAGAATTHAGTPDSFHRLHPDPRGAADAQQTAKEQLQHVPKDRPAAVESIAPDRRQGTTSNQDQAVRHNRSGCRPLADHRGAAKVDMVKRKMQQCCVMFDFTDAMSDIKSKEVKRHALTELRKALEADESLLSEVSKGLLVCQEFLSSSLQL